MRNVIYYLIAATRGGPVRSDILFLLEKKPYNTHQLAKKLSLDYKTVKHHMVVLLKHRLVEKQGKYGGIYFLTSLMKEHMKEIKEIRKQFG